MMKALSIESFSSERRTIEVNARMMASTSASTLSVAITRDSSTKKTTKKVKDSLPTNHQRTHSEKKVIETRG